MVDPVTAGAKYAAVWAADLVWDLTKGAVGNELHLQLRRSLLGAYAQFARDKLPPNHDLARAARAALERALLSFATGLQATTDRNPSAFAKAKAYLLRGPEFESRQRLEQREKGSTWLKAFRALVTNEQRLMELELITDETARTLLASDVNEPARELLHGSVHQWATRHMTVVPGWPADWSRCLAEGWNTRVDGDERITLYQAWALHFREAIKHKHDVFNIFVAGELADGIPAAVCSRIDGTLRGHLEGLYSQLKPQLDRMERKVDWIADRTDQVHGKVVEIADHLAGLKAQLPPMRGAPFAELPAPPETLLGREVEIAALVARLARAEPGAHVITAGVLGMGGVGKTALALAVGHAVRDRFCGGSLFFRLGAHSVDPTAGHEALRRWLEVRAALTNASPPQPGEDLQGRFLRELAQAPGPVLVVVDDPASEADVRVFRPRSGDGLLVTARKPIAGLQAQQLPTLAPADAVALLRELSGRPLSDADAQALAVRCAHLPTALQALGRLLARRPNKPVAEVLAELTAARLPTLMKAARGDPEYDVHVVLQFSVHALSGAERAALQTLCVMPGDFNRSLGAAVVGGDADLLDVLGEAGVLDAEVATNRYRLHDLMREVVLSDTDESVLAAARLRQAKAVAEWLDGCNRAYASAEPDAPALALASFGAERVHLDSALAWLKSEGSNSHLLSSLVWCLSGVGAKLMHPRERLPWHEAAATAARVLGDKRAVAAHLWFQADLHLALGTIAAASELFIQALALHRSLVRELNTPQARRDVSVSLDNVGQVAQAQGDWAQAKSLYRESLEVRRTLARELNTLQARRDVSVSLDKVGEVAQAQG
ncbi:tetratricopeptide repeat protein, partial [Rubrivivax gelatinosus]|uniref:tetratricopeptide repeat protein n=1 Tax=Rubrivivax gelatinosus TaxID=28068 RepID=UPI001A921CF3